MREARERASTEVTDSGVGVQFLESSRFSSSGALLGWMRRGLQ